MIEPWEKLDSQYLGDFRIFRIRQDTSLSPRTGATHRFFVLESPDWVNVIPLTLEGNVILIRQYRHGTEDVTLEVPGGMVDAADADPSVSAARELREETGYEVEAIIHLGSVAPNPAFLNNQCHSYLALGVRPVHEVALDGAEDIAFEEIPLAAIPDLIRSGAITHSLTITAFYYLDLYQGEKNLTQRSQRAPSTQREEGVSNSVDSGEREKNLTQRSQRAPSTQKEEGVSNSVNSGEREKNLTQRSPRAPSTQREEGVSNLVDKGVSTQNLAPRSRIAPRVQSSPTENEIASQVVDAAFRIHQSVGSGLLESAYETLLSHELRQRGFEVARQVLLPVHYGELHIDAGYRIDLLVNDKVIVELKSVDFLVPAHHKQLLTYLRFADKRLGLLINFGDEVFKRAVKRVVNGL